MSPDAHAKTVIMHSWLTTFPPFARLFPASWLADARALGPDSGDGVWGQFTDRRCRFHERHAAHLRRTGQFPYPYMHAECSAPALRGHLEQNVIGRKCEPS